MTGKLLSSDLTQASLKVFKEVLLTLGRVREEAFPKGIENHLAVDLRQYGSFGNCDEVCDKVHPKKLVGIRMQVHSIHSEHTTSECLGSVLFAQSFLMIEQSNFVCITKHVPNFLNWFTTHKHFMNMTVPILIEKGLECD